MTNNTLSDSQPSEPVPTGADGFRDFLTIQECVVYAEIHGLSRTPKTFRKWAHWAHQDSVGDEVFARREDTGNGFRWTIARSWLDKKIREELERRSTGSELAFTGVHPSAPVDTGASAEQSHPGSANPHEPVGTDESHVQRGSGEQTHEHRDAVPSVPASSEPLIEFLTSQLAQKDKQIETKDRQIEAMLDRDRETNILIKGLQHLLGVPELQSPQQDGSTSAAKQDEAERSPHTGKIG